MPYEPTEVPKGDMGDWYDSDAREADGDVVIANKKLSFSVPKEMLSYNTQEDLGPLLGFADYLRHMGDVMLLHDFMTDITAYLEEKDHDYEYVPCDPKEVNLTVEDTGAADDPDIDLGEVPWIRIESDTFKTGLDDFTMEIAEPYTVRQIRNMASCLQDMSSRYGEDMEAILEAIKESLNISVQGQPIDRDDLREQDML